MDKLIRLIFSWEKLRLAIFAEVDWYNSISRTFADPEAMKPVSTMWCEPDGWRGWNIKDDGSYYFHDLPEKGIDDMIDILYWGEK
jgi:hypothetical protein